MISAVFQQHPMLLSAYLKEPMPQSSAGFKLLPSQQKLAKRLHFLLQPYTAEITSLSSKGFHSRNTLEVQPSFRNSLLNTVYHCKPQSAILFTFRLSHSGISEPSRLIFSSCNLRPFWYQSQVWPGQL